MPWCSVPGCWVLRCWVPRRVARLDCDRSHRRVDPPISRTPNAASRCRLAPNAGRTGTAPPRRRRALPRRVRTTISGVWRYGQCKGAGPRLSPTRAPVDHQCGVRWAAGPLCGPLAVVRRGPWPQIARASGPVARAARAARAGGPKLGLAGGRWPQLIWSAGPGEGPLAHRRAKAIWLVPVQVLVLVLVLGAPKPRPLPLHEHQH